MWLKYTPVYKSGYGTPGYAELSDKHLTGQDADEWMDDLKEQIKNEHGDPEGLREPIWEIVKVPPKEVLQRKMESSERQAEYHSARAERLRQLIKDTYHD